MSSSGSFLLFGIVGSVTLLFCSCTGPEPAITEPAIEPAAIQAEPRRAGEEPMSSQEPPAPEPAVEPPQEAPPVEQEQLQEEPPAEQELDESTIVAKIGEYAITRGELEQRVLIELADDHHEDQANTQEPFDVNSVLVEMLAEKAMIIEGRDQNLLEGDSRIKQYKDERLASLLMRKELEGKIVVTDAEIDAALKANVKLDRRRAEAALRGKKQRAASDAFYEQLCKKLRLEKVRHNFPKVAQIHQRLLLRPQGERKQWWITNQQIKEEITPQEKQIVLATFDGGEVNLSDWFETLNRYSPPRRPKDLNTIQGVERLVDATVRLPVLVREAQLRGLDKDETYVRTVMEREDETLLTRVRRQTDEGVPEPTEEEIRGGKIFVGTSGGGSSRCSKSGRVRCASTPTRRRTQSNARWCRCVETAPGLSTQKNF